MKKLKKFIGIALALVMIVMSGQSAFAESGTITGYRTFHLSGGSTSDSFTVDLGDGQGILQGTCIDPNNQNIGTSGGITLTKVDNSSPHARATYARYQKGNSDINDYAVGRALAKVDGRITNQYNYRAYVDEMVNAAYYGTVPPEEFEAYIGQPNNGAQMMVLWRMTEPKRGYVNLKKVTASNNHLVALCPEQYSLEGAVYNVYSSRSLAGSANVGTLTTDASGNSNTIELNKGTYYVAETKAPKGYKLDPTVYSVTVTPKQTATVEVKDEPILVPLGWRLVSKKIEEGGDKNLSVKGAEFTVKYYNTLDSIEGKSPAKTWVFLSDENGEVKWHDSYLKEGEEPLIKDDDGDEAGFIGTYTIEETKAPKGLAKDDKTVYVKIEQNGNVPRRIYSEQPTFDNPIEVADEGIAWNQIEETQKVKLNIQKKDKDTKEAKAQGHGKLEGAKYGVYLNNELVDTLITDENGRASSKELAPDTYIIKEIEPPTGYYLSKESIIAIATIKEVNTRLFEYTYDSLEKVTEVEVDKYTIIGGKKEALKGAVLGIYDGDREVERWTSDGRVHSIKGLEVGKTYTLKELEVPAGYLPLEEELAFTIPTEEKKLEIEAFNEKVPDVHTLALMENDRKVDIGKDKNTLTDTFSYEDVLLGEEYEIRGKVVDTADPNKVIAENSKTFTADSHKGKTEITFTFKGKDYEGKKLVVLTELHRKNRKGGSLVAEHKDINNTDEQIRISKVRTKAFDKKGGKDLFAGDKEIITDTVTYEALEKGKTYTLRTSLYDAESDKMLINDKGDEVLATREFTAEEENSETSIDIPYEYSKLAGKKVVVFEEVLENGIKVGEHKDKSDEEQSIYIPKVQTTATSDGKKKVEPNEKTVIPDEVKYITLIVGKTYTVKGVLMDKSTGKPFLDNGKEVRAEKTFVAEKENGSIELEFIFNSSSLKNKTVVVFEDMYRDKKLVATHSDIEDEGQSVKITKIGKIVISDKNIVSKSGDIVRTGDVNSITMYVLMIIAAIMSLANIFFTRKDKIKKKKGKKFLSILLALVLVGSFIPKSYAGEVNDIKESLVIEKGEKVEVKKSLKKGGVTYELKDEKVNKKPLKRERKVTVKSLDDIPKEIVEKIDGKEYILKLKDSSKVVLKGQDIRLTENIESLTDSFSDTITKDSYTLKLKEKVRASKNESFSAPAIFISYDKDTDEYYIDGKKVVVKDIPKWDGYEEDIKKYLGINEAAYTVTDGSFTSDKVLVDENENRYERKATYTGTKTVPFFIGKYEYSGKTKDSIYEGKAVYESDEYLEVTKSLKYEKKEGISKIVTTIGAVGIVAAFISLIIYILKRKKKDE